MSNPKKMMLPDVVQALNLIVSKGRSLSQITSQSQLSPRQTAWLYGSLRRYHRYQYLLKDFLKKPPKPKDRLVQELLIISLWRLFEGQQPAHAVVNDAVRSLSAMRLQHLKALVNAILRRAGREMSLKQIQNHEQPVVKWSHPKWMLNQFQTDWPENRSEILDANNQQAPMWLRSKTTYRSKYQDTASFPIEGFTEALLLNEAVDVSEIEGFEQGWVSVQDVGAQCAAHLFEHLNSDRVLDACAAPGGKACHLKERFPDIDLIAVELDENRSKRIIENQQRLNLNFQILTADICDLDAWWDGKAFDHILVDAPCSASGVIRRHPDIKLLRRPEDLLKLSRLQNQILEQVWKTLKPGGSLVYCTCSVFKMENDQQIEQFLAKHPDAAMHPFELPLGQATSMGWQILPGQQNADGFYYARLRKKLDEA